MPNFMTMKVSESQNSYEISKIAESNVKNRMKYQVFDIALTVADCKFIIP